ncbi:MAG: hypothetical protein ACK5WY_06625 [Holosporaceae bacterium]|nr:hypothetical protein [Rhodospirillaceae bacterium]
MGRQEIDCSPAPPALGAGFAKGCITAGSVNKTASQKPLQPLIFGV